MSRPLRSVLATASRTLPGHYRARWQEETLAVLLATRGRRRWWYTVDTVVKAPMLAWQLRQSAPGRAPGRWAGALAGAGLLLIPVMVIGGLVLPPLAGEDAAEFVFLIAPAGLLPVVALRSWQSAARRGGGWWWVAAVLVTVFAGTGPVAPGALSVVTGQTWLAIPGSTVPGLWLTAVSVLALMRSTGPVALAALGAVAGLSLVGVLLLLQVMMAGVQHPIMVLLSVTALLCFVPSFTAWTYWSGVRLVMGHTDLLAPAPRTA